MTSPLPAEPTVLPAFDAGVERGGQPIPSEVVLSDGATTWTAIARGLDVIGLRVHVPAADAGGLSPGQAIDLHWERAPIGPLDTSARVVTIDPAKSPRGQAVASISLDLVGLSNRQRRELREQLSSLPSVILTVGLDHPVGEADTASLRIVDAVDLDGVLSRLAQEDAVALVLGPRLGPWEAHALLSRVLAEFPDSPTVNIVLGAGPEPEIFQEFVNRDRIFYLSRSAITPKQLGLILAAAVRHFQSKLEGTADAFAGTDSSAERLLDFCIRLSAQQDLPNAAGLLVETVRTYLAAERAQCLIYDAEKEVLTAPEAASEELRIESAAAGLVGYVARTGESIELDRVADDPRYDREADDPEGAGDAHYVAAPVCGPGDAVLAVVSASRDRDAAPFSPQDTEMLKLLGTCAAPAFAAILWQTRIQNLLRSRAHVAGSADIFRQEALEYHNRSWDEEGELLRTPPRWLRRTHWITLVLLLMICLYASLARISETVSGPVVLRARNKIAVTAGVGGLVRSVEVSVGDRVRAGDLLVRLYDTAGATTLERFREQLQAPSDGIVSDIRVRPGQQINAGEQVASIVDEGAGYELIALLPGSYAPQIQPGMPFVVKLAGYPDSRQSIGIDWVGAEVVGPREGARAAGWESGDAPAVGGPVIVIRSQLFSTKFRSGKREYTYHDGMTGDAELTVRSEPMLVSLVPGLKELWRK